MAFGRAKFGRTEFAKDDPYEKKRSVGISLGSRASFSLKYGSSLSSRASLSSGVDATLVSRSTICERVSSVLPSRADAYHLFNVSKALDSRAIISNKLSVTLSSTATMEEWPGYQAPPGSEGGDKIEVWPFPNPPLNYRELLNKYNAHPSGYTGASRVFMSAFQVVRVYQDFPTKKTSRYMVPLDGVFRQSFVIGWSDGTTSDIGPLMPGTLLLKDFSFRVNENSSYNISFQTNGLCNIDPYIPIKEPFGFEPPESGFVVIITIVSEFAKKGPLRDDGTFDFELSTRKTEWASPEFIIIGKEYELSASSESTKYTAIDRVSYAYTQDGNEFPTFAKVPMYTPDKNPTKITEPFYQKFTDIRVKADIIKRISSYRYILIDEDAYKYQLASVPPGYEYIVRRGVERHLEPEGHETLGIDAEVISDSYTVTDFDAKGTVLEILQKLISPVGCVYKVNEDGNHINVMKMDSGSGQTVSVGNLSVSSLSRRRDASAYKGGFVGVKGSKLKSRFEFVFTKAGFEKVSLGNYLLTDSLHFYVYNNGGYIDLISAFGGDNPETSGYNGSWIFMEKNRAKLINTQRGGDKYTKSLTLAVMPPENPLMSPVVLCKLSVEGIPYDPVSQGRDLKFYDYYPSNMSSRFYKNTLDLSLISKKSEAEKLYPILLDDLNKDYDRITVNTDYPHLYVRLGSMMQGLERYFSGAADYNWRVHGISFNLSATSATTSFELIRLRK